MFPSRKITRFLRLGMVFAAFAAMRATANSQGASGPMPVYNVTDPTYGAAGNGHADDSAAIQSAINAAIASGGIVYFPKGTYLLGSTIPTSGTPFNLSNVILRGETAGGAILETGANQTFTVTSSSGTGAFHGGTIENLTITCQDGPTDPDAQGPGLVMQDSVGLKVRNVIFSRCPTGVEIGNVNGNTYGNDFDDVSFFNNIIGAHFNQVSSGSNTQYYYNNFRVWLNTVDPGDSGFLNRAFQVTGGADVSHNTFNVLGNVFEETVIFDAHTEADAKTNTMESNSYIIKMEPGSGTTTAYLFDGSAVTGTAPTITGTSQIEESCCALATSGTTHLLLSSLESIIDGTFLSAANDFDSAIPADLNIVTIPAHTASSLPVASARVKSSSNGGFCFVTGEDAAGAALAATAWVISNPSSAVINFGAAPSSDAHVRLWCSQ
jgi:hypothetical protein